MVVIGIAIGIFPKFFGRLIGHGVAAFRSALPGIAAQTSLDEFAVTVAKILDDKLPGSEPLKVEQVAQALKDPKVASGLIINTNTVDFREGLNDRVKK